MSAALAPGMRVRCINATPRSARPTTLPIVVGRIYTIRDAFEIDGQAAVILAEDPAHMWLASRFEPLDRRSFEHLLSVTEPTELEPA